MSSSFTSAGAGSRSFGAGRGGAGLGSGPSLADAFDRLRSGFEQRLGPREHHGHDGRDVRGAVLALLAEKPMHGYQIISEIEQRSGGAWKPSAGSVYPTLQLLADEGLVSAEVTEGRKTYSLTEAGTAEAQAAAARGSQWEAVESRLRSMGALPKSGFDLASAAAQVQRTGTPEQVKEAVAILDEARRKLYALLAQG
jgi:DNA-binding PadR family transcriptional regulator